MKVIKKSNCCGGSITFFERKCLCDECGNEAEYTEWLADGHAWDKVKKNISREKNGDFGGLIL